MNVIHTSDWHLGKNLDGNSRLEEQEKFCEEFIKIVDENDIDMIIIAGDIYDRYNPSIEAEKLFYKTVSSLSNNGERCILIVCGEHDNPKRLEAIKPLVKDKGIIIISNLKNHTEKCKYKGFEVLESKEGYIKLNIKGELTNIITLPYSPSYTSSDEVGDTFRKLEENFNEENINIAVGYLKVSGGETRKSEKHTNLLIEKKDLPNKAQYIALGHLHKAQRASERLNAYYCGSPIQYSKDEKNDSKGAYIIELKAKEEPKIIQVYFNNYKSIELFKCSTVKDALRICEENKDRHLWSYFEIKTDKPIQKSDINQMRKILNGIIDIKPITASQHKNGHNEMADKSKGELFKEFYILNNGTQPKGELMDLFLDIIDEEGETKDETN